MNQPAEAFLAQAQSCENLDSSFTATLLRLLAKNLGTDHPVGTFLHDWPDYEKFRSGAVALRLTGALNSLVLLGLDAELKAAYPPNSVSKKVLWLEVDAALRNHHEHILSWMETPPQTNEIRRCCALIPGFHLIAKETGLPLVMSEIGASAGLNQSWDSFALEIGNSIWGPKDAAIRLSPEWRGPPPPLTDISILDREACDLNPLDPCSPQDRLRLLSYIWPDQFQRVQNTKLAIDLACNAAHTVHQQDALEFLQKRLKPVSGATRVIYHSIMWQYLTDDAQAQGEAMIRNAGKEATPNTPLAWLRAEADETPRSAAITLNLWPSGETRELGRMDFHGRWIKWNGA